MKFHNFKSFVKYGLCLILIVSLIGTAYADTSQITYNSTKEAGNDSTSSGNGTSINSSINNNVKGSVRQGGIALSWDDTGHIDTCHQYLPLFIKYNAKCTMNVNRINDFQAIAPATLRSYLKDLHAAGWEIATHGYHHLDSRKFLDNHTPEEWKDQEIYPNIEELTGYGYPVYTLSYPFSNRTSDVDSIVSPYFRSLRTGVPDVVNDNVNETDRAYYDWDDDKLLYGVEIDERSNKLTTESIENGIQRAIDDGTVLVLYGHAIAPVGKEGEYITSTTRLEAILNYTHTHNGTFYHLGDLGDSNWVPPADFIKATANFTVSTNNISAGNNVTFVDHSLNQTSELLDFGDGSPTSNISNVIHNYTIPGNYTANLTAENPYSRNSTFQTITVLGQPSANFYSSRTSGYAPLTIQFTDTTTGDPNSWNWNFGDGESSIQQNPSHTYSSAGDYCVNLTVNNSVGNSSKTATINVYEESSGGSSGGSSSGGSGGGGGGSPEPATNVQVKELAQTSITNGKPVRFDFSRQATCIISITFDAKKTAGKTTGTVEMLKEKSTLVSELPSGEIYKFFNIWVGNAGFSTPNNIANPVINFKVEKSWIKDKNIDPASITLNRYSDKKWEQISASLTGEDDNYLYFTAKTPGFSPFGITGKAIAKAPPEITPAPGNQENINNISSEVPQKTGTEQKTETPASKPTPGFEVVFGVAGLFAVFRYKRK